MNQYIIELSRWGIYNNGTKSLETTNGINNALVWAKSMGYDSTFLPAGTYLINAKAPNFGIHILDKLSFNMHPDCILKAESNDQSYYAVIQAVQVTSLKISGGQIIGDRDTHSYVSDPSYGNTHEWGFGIRLRGTTNITISKVNIKDTTGDAIILEDLASPLSTNKNTIIKNCVLDHCRRQGISITSGENALIEDCTIKNISGTAPQYGIDIEHYGFGSNILINRCNFSNNSGGDVDNYNGYKVTVRGCDFTSTLATVFGYDSIYENNNFKDDTKTKGAITGTELSDYSNKSITIRNNIINGYNVAIDFVNMDNLIIENNTFSNSATAGYRLNNINKLYCKNNNDINNSTNYFSSGILGGYVDGDNFENCYVNFESGNVNYKNLSFMNSTIQAPSNGTNPRILYNSTIDMGNFSTTRQLIGSDTNVNLIGGTLIGTINNVAGTNDYLITSNGDLVLKDFKIRINPCKFILIYGTLQMINSTIESVCKVDTTFITTGYDTSKMRISSCHFINKGTGNMIVNTQNKSKSEFIQNILAGKVLFSKDSNDVETGSTKTTAY